MAYQRKRLRYPLRGRTPRFDLPRQRRRRRVIAATSNNLFQDIDVATIALTAQDVTPTGTGTASVTLDPVAASLTAQDLVATGTGTTSVTLDIATLTLSPQSLTAMNVETFAFVEPFTTSAALTRFSISNFRTSWDNEETTPDGQDNTQGFGPDLPNNTRVTSGQAVVESGMQNYGETTLRSNAPWAGDGTIEFDVIGDDISAENQVVFLVLDRPYAFTGFDGENANGPKPANGFGFYAGTPRGRAWDEYVQTDYPQGGTPGPPNGTYETGVLQHWVLSVNSTHVWLTIDGDDVNVGEDIGGGVRRIPLPTGFDPTGAWITIGTHNHASFKYAPFAETVTNIFDNLEYEALLAARVCEVPISGGESFGWQLQVAGGGTPVVHNTTSLALGTGATQAWLILNVGCYDANDLDADSRLTYSLNGNTDHAVAFQIAEHTVHFAKSLSIPVSLAELVDGVNTVEVFASDVAANPTLLRYANVQLVVLGGVAVTEQGLDPASLTLSAQDLTWTHPTATSIDHAPVTLTAQDLVATGAGAASVTLDVAQLTLTPQELTASATGAAAVTVDVAQLTLTGQDVTATGTGTSATTSDIAALTLTAQELTATGSGASAVTLDPATLSLTAQDLQPDGGTIVVTLDIASITLTPQDVTGTGSGTAGQTIDNAALTLTPQDVGFTHPTAVTPDAAMITLTGQELVATATGTASVDLDPAILTLTAVDVQVAGGTVQVTLDIAVLTLGGQEITATGTGTTSVDLDPALLSIGALELVASTNSVAVTIDPAQIVLAAQDVAAGGSGVAAVTVDVAGLGLQAQNLVPFIVPVYIAGTMSGTWLVPGFNGEWVAGEVTV